jgi:hypothetical protein
MLTREMGLRLEEPKLVKGDQRRLVMELLYRVGGLKGEEIGSLFRSRRQCRQAGKKAVDDPDGKGCSHEKPV